MATHDMTATAPARAALADLRGMLEDVRFTGECAEQLGCERAEVARHVQACLGEAAVALQLLAGLDLAGRRVLEVGAGLGIVALALHRVGVEIVAIEPGLGGFDRNAVIGARLRQWCGDSGFAHLPLSAVDLDPRRHGLFDVIFSVNVLEHIPGVEAALGAMCRVLRPGGLMRHTCPNYAVPYEPHFGIPLVPGLPRLTGWLVPGIARTEVWQSLNFITAGQVRRVCVQNGLSCRFLPGTMYEAFRRLETDAGFGQRQGTARLVAVAHHLLRRSRLLPLIARWPPGLATPMTFEASRAG